jgi:hypothetical protein
MNVFMETVIYHSINKSSTLLLGCQSVGSGAVNGIICFQVCVKIL